MSCDMKEFKKEKEEDKYLETPSTNACKQCAPLGASLAFKGIENCVPLIHGSQGCATYIRRYMISHYREPIDIASSSFAESSTIFGGGRNFNVGIDNIIKSYQPDVIGISTSCLSETIGDDVRMFIKEYKEARPGEKMPFFVNASTPSYRGTHIDGFHSAVKRVVECCAETDDFKTSIVRTDAVNLFPGVLSPADIRYLKEILEDYELEAMVLPDYSDTLDGPSWVDYEIMPKGGTPIAQVMHAGEATASIQFGYILASSENGAGDFLSKKYDVTNYTLGMPVGIKETDAFHKTLRKITGIPLPKRYKAERARLVDALIDGHKYIFGKKAIIYGDADLVCGITSFACEMGLNPVLCATGDESPEFEKRIKEIVESSGTPFEELPKIIAGADFETIKEVAEELEPDLVIGNSKGYYISKPMEIPLVRCGFPIHDRIGAQRVLHVGYHGSMQLFDNICNALIEYKQENSKIGYKYI